MKNFLIISLTLAALVEATTYEIKSKYCTVLYDSFSHKIKTNGDCLVKNASGNEQLFMECFYKKTYEAFIQLVYVNENDYFITQVKEGKTTSNSYDFINFSSDLNNGAFKNCQLKRTMTINEKK
ncbi:hypothetical protein SAMN05720781_2816 [Fibrobacter sp. UWT3]|uniref:hypothetical protein n=1 Tax=Fibrobacter sp. UWT3 TaxID=1896225 RepID=UPI000BD06586|nr:hypothetical protein [Fibrobacter sp. UWT3]SOE78990.1 hypothetical protein SAMN05720781_2816 [Fibrobacter sp. UWT3]